MVQNYDDEVKDMVSDVIEHELRAAESTEQVVNYSTLENFEQAAEEVANDYLESANSDKMRRRILMVLAQLGQSVGSETVAMKGKKELEKMVEES